MKLAVFASVQVLAFGSTCYEQFPLTCPEGTYCTHWNDGCNDCGCHSPDDKGPSCTKMYCSCYDDGSCIPRCLDNDACVSQTTIAVASATKQAEAEPDEAYEDPVLIAEEEAKIGSNSADLGGGCEAESLFDCPETNSCKRWNDGCNICSCGDGDTMGAACTYMACPCQLNNSCVPKCLDNEKCTPKNATGSAFTTLEDGSESIAKKHPFVCPEDETCTSWSDGCNDCHSVGEDEGAACTRMYCECYKDDSCVPVCHDNRNCVAPNSRGSRLAQPTDSSGGNMSMIVISSLPVILLLTSATILF